MHGLMLSLFVKFSNGLPLCKFYPLPVTCNTLVDVSFTCWLTCWCKFYLLPVDSLVNVSFTCYMLTHLVNVEGRKLLSLRLGGLNAVLRDKQLPHIAYSPTRYHLLQNMMKTVRHFPSCIDKDCWCGVKRAGCLAVLTMSTRWVMMSWTHSSTVFLPAFSRTSGSSGAS